MYQKLLTFIGLLFLLFSGFFSVNAFATTHEQAAAQCAIDLANASGYFPGASCTDMPNKNVTDCSGSFYLTKPDYNSIPSASYSGCSTAPPCPAAGTPYTGYYPAHGAATDTVYAPNGSSSTCAVSIDNKKTSCPPNTVMPTFGTAEPAAACIVTGTYTGSAGPSGAQANAVSPPSSPSDCPAGTGSYFITNGTTTTTGCGTTSKATSSNPSAPPASTTPTGPNATNTTTTNSSSTTTPNSTTGGSDTVGTSTTTNNAAGGGAGQPACNVNSTCGGAGQPACNTNIGDSTFTVATPTMTGPIFTDKTQGTVPTSGFSVTNYTSAGSSSCPVTDQTGSVFGQSFTLPFSQICQYLDFVHYIVIIAAAIAAMKLI